MNSTWRRLLTGFEKLRSAATFTHIIHSLASAFLATTIFSSHYTVPITYALLLLTQKTLILFELYYREILIDFERTTEFQDADCDISDPEVAHTSESVNVSS
ncbi:unnamed protein product [Wuchereria bancrofti]|uniref:Uncharacterized protein n=1 Tax=Wuchereria bancrofti TaxID=6293 RepID=A0A3P7E007_WUCBA|nr:unnamed protein product [Wuchereria bancrofti]